MRGAVMPKQTLVYVSSQMEGTHPKFVKERIHMDIEDLNWLAKKASLFVHDADLNNVRAVGGRKQCHNSECRCQKGGK